MGDVSPKYGWRQKFSACRAELADFTETVVPLKITGTMSAPSIRPDIEGIFRARVEEVLPPASGGEPHEDGGRG